MPQGVLDGFTYRCGITLFEVRREIRRSFDRRDPVIVSTTGGPSPPPGRGVVEPLRNRMPVTLPERAYSRGLDVDSSQLPMDLLRPYEADQMKAWEVDKRIGNVRTDSPGLLEEQSMPPKGRLAIVKTKALGLFGVPPARQSLEAVAPGSPYPGSPPLVKPEEVETLFPRCQFWCQLAWPIVAEGDSA
jgi:hypothetical protein